MDSEGEQKVLGGMNCGRSCSLARRDVWIKKAQTRSTPISQEVQAQYSRRVGFAEVPSDSDTAEIMFASKQVRVVAWIGL